MPERAREPFVRLDDWRCGDRALVVAMHRDADVMRYLGGPMSAARTHQAIDGWMRELARTGSGLRPVRSAEDELVGLAGVAHTTWTSDGEHLEIAWRLAREHWGNGYATAAGRAVLAECSPTELDEISAFVALDNVASQRVADRLGLVRDRSWRALRTYDTQAEPRGYGRWVHHRNKEHIHDDIAG